VYKIRETREDREGIWLRIESTDAGCEIETTHLEYLEVLG
jgi:hypothetical protein